MDACQSGQSKCLETAEEDEDVATEEDAPDEDSADSDTPDVESSDAEKTPADGDPATDETVVPAEETGDSP